MPSQQWLSNSLSISDPETGTFSEGLVFDQEEGQTLMAICTDGSRCGAVVYKDSSVYLIADRRDPGDPYKGLDIIIHRNDPQVVVVSAVQKRLINFIEKRCTVRVLDLNKKETCRTADKDQAMDVSIASDGQNSSIQAIEVDISEPSLLLVIVPNIWFAFSAGMQKLLESELVSSKGITDPEEKLLFVTSKVEKSVDVCAIRSIAALNRYTTYEYTKQCANNLAITNQTQASIQRLSSQSAKPKESVSEVTNLMPIIAIKYLDPAPILSIDKFSFESLGIFYNVFNKNQKDEEYDEDNLPSLHELLNRCCSIQGKIQLRSIMMWPIQDIDELRHRHDTVEFFLRPQNAKMRDQILLHLKNVVPLNITLMKMNQSISSYRDLLKVFKALWSFMAIMDFIKEDPDHNLVILDRLTSLDSASLRQSVQSIVNIVDFEGSKRENRVQVAFGVDSNVDEKRELVSNLAKFCDEVAVEETAKYKDMIGKTFKVIYIPRIGFLACIDFTSTTELMHIRFNRQFDVLMYTDQTVYFKTKRMEELDNNAGDVACDLIDVQESVIVELQKELLKQTDTILELTFLCGKLDCLIAFSLVSLERSYTRPEFVTSDQEMEIHKAYNPLQCTRQNVVPNDVRFYNNSLERAVKVMVITGPNSCGKTTYMKTVCLVVYMAHIGCFVPATLAKLPIVDAILTRIHSANSISTGLSSFATDLRQINYALERATSRSLIAIDEFGKGTQARDGFHLLKALVIYFASRAQMSPYIVVTTHYNRLVNHLQSYSGFILYKTFKVSRDQAKETITYEYEILDGVGEISLADQVAASAGVPNRIIERAKVIRDYITEGRIIKPMAPHGA